MSELRPAIYLDSLPVQHMPLEAREIWGPHETRPSEEQFAEIVRGAESCRPNLTPQSAGFFAASLGYSHIYRNALSQLAAVMGFYDAMYRWCREETIKAPSWPSPASLGSHQI